VPTGALRIKGMPSSATPARRQRSIRSTITLLLIIPLLSLIALWVYAASGTVGPALAKQHSAALNNTVGQPILNMSVALQTERAQAFAWQASGGRSMSQAQLQQLFGTSDAAVAAWKAADAKAAGVESAQVKPQAMVLSSALSRLGPLRQQITRGTIKPLEAFNAYNAIMDATIPYAVSLANPDSTIPLYQESEAQIAGGQGIEALARQGALLGGVLAGGGYMTQGEYREFLGFVEDQKQDFATAQIPLYWQLSPDPYPAALKSPAYQAFAKLQASIVTHGPGRLTLAPKATQATFQNALVALGVAELVARQGVTADQDHQGTVVLAKLYTVGGAGLLAVILSAFLLLRFGGRIARELTGLRGAARMLSGERLPSVVRRLRAGEDVDVAAEAPPLDLRTRTREVTDTAEAFSVVQHTAVEAAVEQAQLRKGVSNVFRSLARRNQSLVQRQLRMLDEMERGTQDPDALAQLFRLDHLTTRMRRQAEGLIILSGAAPGRRWRQPVPVVEALRGAISEIEDYVRVDLVTDSADFLTGAAVADVTHLLAELIENAVVYSPPATRVQVRGGRVANGYVIEIEDRGLGIPVAIRETLNDRLAQPPEFDLADSDQLGLFVVSRLAVRNGIRVSLREAGYGGTTAIVLLPASLVVSEMEASQLAAQGSRGALAAAGQPADDTGEPASILPERRTPWLDRPASPHPDLAPAGSPADGRGAPPWEADPTFTGGTFLADGADLYAGQAPDPAPPLDIAPPLDTAPPFGNVQAFGNGQALGNGGNGFGGSVSDPGTGFGNGSVNGPGSGFGDSGASGPGNGFGSGQPARGGGPGPDLPTRASRGSFGNPKPFQDAPAPFDDGPAAPRAFASPFQDPPAPARAPGQFHAAGDGGGQSAGTGPNGLPKRQKMASMAPQLRDSRPETPNSPLVGRSPEQARALLSSIQRGLRTGRDEGAEDGAANGTENGAAGTDDEAHQ
jgi:signal transduction histidine kinase